MCDKAVDSILTTLKFVPDWFVTKSMVKNLDDAGFSNDDIVFFNKDSGNATFSSDEMHILSVGLNNINLDDTNFYEDNSETIIYVRLMTWCNKFKQRKVCKKEIIKELMPVA